MKNINVNLTMCLKKVEIPVSRERRTSTDRGKDGRQNTP